MERGDESTRIADRGPTARTSQAWDEEPAATHLFLARRSPEGVRDLSRIMAAAGQSETRGSGEAVYRRDGEQRYEDNTMPQNTDKLLISLLIAASLAGAAGSGWSAETDTDAAMIDRGRYLAQVAGCNDCHTPGYLMSNGDIPESQWLMGDSFGWRGPWGTTYPSNLRLFLKDMSEDQWVKEARTLKRRAPMPWYTLNKMHEDDLRALYRFIVSLGEPGRPAPAYVPPDREPNTPYALFPSPPEAK